MLSYLRGPKRDRAATRLAYARTHPNEETVKALGELLSAGGTIIDGATRTSRTDAPAPPGAAPEIQIYADAPVLVAATVDTIFAIATRAITRRGRFTIALSGGSTRRAVYERLGADAELPWDQTEFCFGEERAVPADHPDSNARMVRESLLRHGFCKPERVHCIPAELAPGQGVFEYEHTLRALFPGAPGPAFDVVLLGLGPDAHTASLFPGSPRPAGTRSVGHGQPSR